MNIDFDSHIKLLNLSPRSYHALEAKGVEKLKDLLQYDSLQKLLKIRNIGEISALEILYKIRSLKVANEELFLFKKEPLSSLNKLKEYPIFSDRKLSNATVVLNPKLEEYKVEILSLSPRCIRCLKLENIKNLFQLLNTYPHQLLKHRNFGFRSLNELRFRLCDFFKLNIDEYVSFSALRERRIREKALEVKKLYDTLGTYETVGRALGITRERVRQVLEEAAKRGWLLHETKHYQEMKLLAEQLPKEKFVNELLVSGSMQKLAKNLGVKDADIKELANQYNVDARELRERYLIKKALRQYEEMVNELGYHPTTTLMQRNKKWRSLNFKICRVWGSMNNFRREFGLPIPKPGNPRFSEDIALARLERKRRAKLRKEKNEESIVNVVKTFGYAQTGIICKQTGIGHATFYELLKELISENKLVREGRGNKTYYRLSNGYGTSLRF